MLKLSEEFIEELAKHIVGPERNFTQDSTCPICSCDDGRWGRYSRDVRIEAVVEMLRDAVGNKQ